MKSLIPLWRELSEEFGEWCGTSTLNDYKYIVERFKHEGDSFLTITLPSFGKDFEKSLERGKVEHALFQGFTWKGGLPQFLGGFLAHVFDRGTGRLLDEPDMDSIFAVRQLTLMFSKMLLPTSERRTRAAMKGFVDVEREVRGADRSISAENLEDFRRMSALLFSDIFTEMDDDVYHGNITGKHGPGKTAERILGNQKFVQRSWPTRLESIFPILDHALPNPGAFRLLDRVDFPEPGSETPVRVVSVPKTLKSPRIIAIEPVAMQYMQQGLMEKFVKYLERKFSFREERENIVHGMIGFSSQIPNQEMARKGSSRGELATLDLSEASDRVSNQHVRAMLHNWPHLHEAVDATRSRKADVRGHGVVRLAKYASMGSGLCFPMEAMVFLTVVFLGLQAQDKRQFTRKDVVSFAGRVRVYGDDIIVPVDYVRSVIGYLESFGFKVNADKSFWNGKFRESCGKEYYDGHDVSVVKCRRLLPTERRHAAEIMSLISLRNQLYFAGLWRTTKWLDERIEGMRKIIPVYPTVHPGSPALGRHSVLDYQIDYASDSYHVPLVRALVASSRLPEDILDGEYALVKWFTKRGEKPIPDVNHLLRAGRPEVVHTKLRYVMPY
jgi:hypothetical protein